MFICERRAGSMRQVRRDIRFEANISEYEANIYSFQSE